MTRLAPIMQGFFTDHLITQRHASPHTVTSYRDTFTLLLGYAHQRSGKLPAQLDIADLDAVLIGAFLTHLETERGNSAATRNARLAAIRSLFRYASLRAPEHAATDRPGASHPCQAHRHHHRLLPRPRRNRRARRSGRRHPKPGTDAVTTPCWRWPPRPGFASPSSPASASATSTWAPDAHVCCRGKGRRDRCTPLTPPTVRTLTAWLTERRGQPGDPLFPTRHGNPLSRDAVARLLSKYRAAGEHVLPRPERQDHQPPHPQALCGGPCYVAGSLISAGSRASRAGSGHITRWCYSQNRSSHSRRSWSAVQSGRGSGVSDW